MTLASSVIVLVGITILFYILACICFFSGNIGGVTIVRLAYTFAIIGCMTNLFTLMTRFLLTGRLPLNNGSEFLLSFAWVTVISYLIYSIRSNSKNAGGIVMLTAALLIGSILILSPSQLGSVSPIVPALKSPWLTIHVITAVLAYGGFALAAGIAAMQLKQKQPDLSGEGPYRIVAASFAMLTLTIVFGGIWAEQVWGRYWSWDPKETWALITWIIYAVYLHIYRRRELKGQTANTLIVVGFVLVLFTYYGVNYLLTGLHSYS